MSTLTDTEPALTVGTITGLAAAVIAALAAFGLDLPPDQRQAILGIVAIVAPVLAGILTRRLVWAPASVRDVVTGKTAPPDAPTKEG